MNPNGQKSVKDLFNGAAGVHGDIEQWRSAPHSAVTPKMPGFSPKQFKLTGFSCTTLHPKQVALFEWPWRAFFFPADVFCCWKGLDPVRCISQVSQGAISGTATRWVSKRRPNIRNVALALPGAPFFFFWIGGNNTLF